MDARLDAGVDEHLGANPWSRFVTETYRLQLIDRGRLAHRRRRRQRARRTGRLRQRFGPESWTEIAGLTWSLWDLWFCAIAVLDHDGRLAAGHSTPPLGLAEDDYDVAGSKTLWACSSAWFMHAAAAAHGGDFVAAQRRLQRLNPLLPSLSLAMPFDAFHIHLLMAEASASGGGS